MARKARSTTLETRTNRLKLPVDKKPIWVTVGRGIGVGYRRNRFAGTWSARSTDGHGGSWIKKVGLADDHESADGVVVLDYWQAVDKAIATVRGTGDSSGAPLTVADALNAYEADLKARGADLANVGRIRFNVPDNLKSKIVGLLTLKELRAWRDGLVKRGLAPATADRIARALKAALTLAASDDRRITNSAEWRDLERLPDGETARNVILSDEKISDIVGAAYTISTEYGALVEAMAVTGARQSQLARLQVHDFKDDKAAPRLMMPPSRKGRNRKIAYKPVAITPRLAVTLKKIAAGRALDAPLLSEPDGRAWRKAKPRALFMRLAARLGLDPEVTLYALRHSSIVRQLLRNVPIRVVADSHDTSTRMIEAHYSAFISDHTDALTRHALPDLDGPAGSNVVSIGLKP